MIKVYLITVAIALILILILSLIVRSLNKDLTKLKTENNKLRLEVQVYEESNKKAAEIRNENNKKKTEYRKGSAHDQFSAIIEQLRDK